MSTSTRTYFLRTECELEVNAFELDAIRKYSLEERYEELEEYLKTLKVATLYLTDEEEEQVIAKTKRGFELE